MRPFTQVCSEMDHWHTLIGRRIDERFKLLSELSSDLACSLFLAQDEQTGRAVYIRVLAGLEHHYIACADAMDLSTSVRDGRILPVCHHGRTAGLVYYALPFEAGLSECRSLHEVLAAQGALPVARAVNIAAQLSAVLERVHDRGLFHGNLNPRSVLLVAGESGEQIRLWDFGMAPGTPGLYMAHYSAPERLQGQPADARSDIYSLGAMLYQMCTGLPLQAAEESERLRVVSTPAAQWAGEPPLSEALATLVVQCLQQEPTRRPHSMLELTRLLGSPKTRHPPASRLRPYLAGGAALLVAAVGGWVLKVGIRPAQLPPVAAPPLLQTVQVSASPEGVDRTRTTGERALSASSGMRPPPLLETGAPARLSGTNPASYPQARVAASSPTLLAPVARAVVPLPAPRPKALPDRERPPVSGATRLASEPLRPSPPDASGLLKAAPLPVQHDPGAPSSAMLLKGSPQPLLEENDPDRLRSAPQPFNP